MPAEPTVLRNQAKLVWENAGRETPDSMREEDEPLVIERRPESKSRRPVKPPPAPPQFTAGSAGRWFWAGLAGGLFVGIVFTSTIAAVLWAAPIGDKQDKRSLSGDALPPEKNAAERTLEGLAAIESQSKGKDQLEAEAKSLKSLMEALDLLGMNSLSGRIRKLYEDRQKLAKIESDSRTEYFQGLFVDLLVAGAQPQAMPPWLQPLHLNRIAKITPNQSDAEAKTLKSLMEALDLLGMNSLSGRIRKLYEDRQRLMENEKDSAKRFEILSQDRQRLVENEKNLKNRHEIQIRLRKMTEKLVLAMQEFSRFPKPDKKRSEELREIVMRLLRVEEKTEKLNLDALEQAIDAFSNSINQAGRR